VSESWLAGVGECFMIMKLNVAIAVFIQL